MSNLVDADFKPEMKAITDVRIGLCETIQRRVFGMSAPLALALVLSHISTGDLETIARFLERDRA